MTLCIAKYFADKAGRVRRPALAVLALALILALPVAGGLWGGLPASVWLEFPPRQVVVQHAAFQGWVWTALALAILAAVLPVVWRVARAGRRSCERERGRDCATGGPGMPAWGWAGFAWMLAAWGAAWTRLPLLAPIQRHTYVLVWAGYIVTVLALTQRRAGTCLLTRSRAALAGLAVSSALFWWGFEFLNRGVQNWFYQNLEGFSPPEYALLATLCFTTVLPAVLGTHDFLATLPRLTAGLEDWVTIRFARPRLAGAGFALAGAVGLFFLPVCPNTLFPLLWMAPLGLLCGLLAAAGEATVFDDLGHGDWRTLVRLSLAALICGWFWEMWNMHSLARWVYDVPYVGRFRVFEMPLLGFAGYGPFGWECAAVAMAFGLWQPPQAQQGVTGTPNRDRWDGVACLTKMNMMKIRKHIALAVLLAVAYPVLYVGARSSKLLVRTCEAIDWTGRPSKCSNRIIPGRGFITFKLLGCLSWHVFYPAHRLETWYRNRPSYFFREAIEREKRSNQASEATSEPAPSAVSSVPQGWRSAVGQDENL